MKKRSTCKKLRRHRTPQGDLRSRSETRNVRGSLNAVYSQRWMLWATQRNVDIHMRGDAWRYERQQKAGTEENPEKHISETRIRVRLPRLSGAQARRLKKTPCKSRMPRPRSATSGTSLPAWDFNKVKPKSEVVQQAKKDSKSVHFASRSAQLICELIQRQCVPEFCGTGTSTICSRDEARLHQFGKKMLPRKVMRYVFVRGEDRQEICSSRIVKMSRTCQPPIVTSNGPSTQKSHKQCTRMSQARRYSSTPSRRNAHWGTPRAGRKRGTGYYFFRMRKR